MWRNWQRGGKFDTSGPVFRNVTFWHKCGSGSGSSDPYLSFYAYSFLKVHLHHSSKIKSQKVATKTVEIKVFLNFACRWKDPDSVGPKKFGTGTLRRTVAYKGPCRVWVVNYTSSSHRFRIWKYVRPKAFRVGFLKIFREKTPFYS